MLLHDCTTAPNCRRVRIFAAEKGIELPSRQVDLKGGEHLGEAFLALNPDGTVPVLELDDGTALGESVAICHYLEELHPEPRLLGMDPADRARVSMWQRRMEHSGLLAVAEAFRNEAPGLRDHALPGRRPVPQIPALAERGRLRYDWFLEDLERRLAEVAFVAGERFTIADITALVAVDFARRALGVEPPAEGGGLGRWYREVSARPSAGA